MMYITTLRTVEGELHAMNRILLGGGGVVPG